MSLKKVCKAIKENNKFLITAHYDPEGDSIGSQLAMADILGQLGKRYTIVNMDSPPERYEFLKDIKQITRPSSKKYDFDVALVLDCPVLERIGNVSQIIHGQPIVNIDHHVSNRNFGAINCVQKTASSSGEIIYELAKALNAKFNKNLAMYIYMAMLADTGGFRYSNTSAKTMRIAAELLKFGISPKDMYERIYESHSLASRKLLALGLATLKVSKTGKIAWMRLTKAMFDKTNAAHHDAENFINYPRFINGVKMAVLFSDASPKKFVKVSFRSNQPDIDVNRFAKKFGGGGHVSASGCHLKGHLEDIEKKIIKEAEEFVK